MIRFALPLIALALVACATPPPEEEELRASPGVIGQERFAEAGVEGVFANATLWRDLTVRHGPSGLTCFFGDDEDGEPVVVSRDPEVVACRWRREGVTIEVRARRADGVTPRQAVVALGVPLMTTQPMIGGAPRSTLETAPDSADHMLWQRAERGFRFNRVAAATSRGWLISMSYQAFVRDGAGGRRAEAESASLWRGTILDARTDPE